MNVIDRSSQGVMMPIYAMTVRTAETASIRVCAIIITRRRSQMSAVAPDGSDSSMMGRVVDAWTNATMSAEGAIDVISHDAPTPWMRLPKFEIRLAVQMAAKTRE
jgi:hypothetical protein